MKRTIKYFAIAVLLVTVLGSFVVYGTIENNPGPTPNPSLLFVLQPNHQLQSGGEIMYQGVQIGSIEVIKLVDAGGNKPVKVATAIFDEPYFAYLYREMDFVLSRDRRRVGWWYVEITDIDVNNRTPLPSGTWIPLLTSFEKRRENAIEFMNDVMDEIDPIQENLQERFLQGLRNLNEQIASP